MSKIKLSELGSLKNGLNFNSGNIIYGGCKIIGIPDFADRYIADLRCLSEVDSAIVNEDYLLRKDDILFVRSNGNKALVGRTMIIGEVKERITYSGFCIRFRPDKDKVLPLFLLYLFKSPQFRKQFSKSQQTSINNLNQDTLGSIIFDLPDIHTQEMIVKCIHSITQKIETNKAVNDNLQHQLKLMYDYWFTQFDFPDENGKPYRASGGAMVWNPELQREIPIGWECRTLGDLLTKNSECFDYSSIEPTIDLSVMPSASISLQKLNSSNQFTTNLFIMREGDILFGSIRPYLKKAGIAPCNGVVAGTVYSYRVKSEHDYNFALFTICRDSFFDYALAVSTGTKMPVVSSDSILSYKIPYSRNVVAQFNQINILQIICNNVREANSLSSFRDWLLPMLMNGQATISD